MARQSRNQMQHEIHRLRRERDLALSQFDGRKVLERIALALAQIAVWSDPTPSYPPDSDGPKADQWDRPEPGAGVRMFTNAERRYLRRLRALAADMEAFVSPDGPVVLSRQERAALTAANEKPGVE